MRFHRKTFIQISTKYIKLSLLLVGLLVAPIISSAKAYAGPFFSEYPISSGYNGPTYMLSTTGSDGSLWYTESDSSTGTASLANMTTSGVVTDYSLTPSEYSLVQVSDMKLGHDGNIWFAACAIDSPYGYTVLGKFDTSSKAVTLTKVENNCERGLTLAIDDDGNIWMTETQSIGDGYSTEARFFTSSGAMRPGTTSLFPAICTNSAMGPNNTLWCTNWRTNTVSKIPIANGTASSQITTSYILPTASSGVGRITQGSDGNMWFTEYHGIGKIAPDGTITEYSSLCSGACSIANITSGSDGALWFTDYYDRIGRITTSGSASFYTIPTSGGSPYGIVSGPDGAIWFGESGSNKVGRVPTTPFFSEYPISSSYKGPGFLLSTTGQDGSLWYTEQNSTTGETRLANMTTSGVVTDYSITPDGYRLVQISNLIVGSDDNLWFSGCALDPTRGYTALGKFDVSSKTVTLTDTGTSCGSVNRTPLAFDNDGNIWLVKSGDYYGNYIERYSAAGVYLGYTYLPGKCTYMASGPNNTLWCTDSSTNTIIKLTLSNGSITGRATYALPTPSSGVGRITQGPDGNMWFTEYYGVGKITPSAAITEYSLFSPGSGSIQRITVGSDGAIWFTNYYDQIGRITTSGSVSLYAIPTSGGNPYGIISGPDGAIWFTENSANKIGRLGY